MAVTRVFDIGELLEMILLELPTKDLLLSQRVSKAWKGAVDTSTRIQKALFMVPGGAQDVNVELVDEMVVRSKPGKLSANYAERLYFVQHLEAVKESGIAFNPLLVLDIYAQITEHCVEPCLRLELFDLPEHASGRRMHFTQPPVDFRTIRMYRMRYGNFASGVFAMPTALCKSPVSNTLGTLVEAFHVCTEELKKDSVELVLSNRAMRINPI